MKKNGPRKQTSDFGHCKHDFNKPTLKKKVDEIANEIYFKIIFQIKPHYFF